MNTNATHSEMPTLLTPADAATILACAGEDAGSLEVRELPPAVCDARQESPVSRERLGGLRRAQCS